MFRGQRHELRTVTSVYTQARYAAEPPAPPTVAAARAALDRLKALRKPEHRGGAPGT